MSLLSNGLWSIFTLFTLFHVTFGQEKWCGKNYKEGTPVIEPGGRYPVPSSSDGPLLLFRCEAAVKPYLENDDTNGGVLIDLEITHTNAKGTTPITSDIANKQEPKFLIQVSTGDLPLLTAGVVGLGKNQLLEFPLFALQARKEKYELTCKAQFISDEGEESDGTGMKEAKEAVMDVTNSYSTSAQLSYLPPSPYGGSTVKIDTVTKALLVKGENEWKPILPYGFYASFDGYLAKDLSVLDEMAAMG